MKSISKAVFGGAGQSTSSRGKGAAPPVHSRSESQQRFGREGSIQAGLPASPSVHRSKATPHGLGGFSDSQNGGRRRSEAGTSPNAGITDEDWVGAALDHLNKEAVPAARALRGMRTLEQPVKIAVAARLAASVEADTFSRGRATVHALVVAVEQHRRPQGGTGTVATIYDMSIGQTTAGGPGRSAAGTGMEGPRPMQVMVRRSWTLDRLSSVERPEMESASFSLVFVSSGGAVMSPPAA
ncbi:unnamed protein product, partial [Phaeothamnion confervicola]